MVTGTVGSTTIAPATLHHVCPMCGARALRVHREPLDHLAGLFGWTRRYACTHSDCGWVGLLGRYDVGRLRGEAAAGSLALVQSAAVRRRALDGLRFLGGFIGSAVALAAIGWAMGIWPATTIVPAPVVTLLVERIEAGRAIDIVKITRNGIVGERSRCSFSPTLPAMAFGQSLCFNARVNFRPGHIELGKLYEAVAVTGDRYVVMVPYICGNVAVLAERGEADDDEQTIAAPGSLSLIAAALLAAALLARRSRFRGDR